MILIVWSICVWFFTETMTNNNNKDSRPDRKEDRRQKIDKKFSRKDEIYDEDGIRSHQIKRERKKLQEELDDEEWENWDRYYNH